MKTYKQYLNADVNDIQGTFEFLTGCARATPCDPGSASWDIDDPRMEYDGDLDYHAARTITTDDDRPVFLLNSGEAVVREPDGRFAKVSVELKAYVTYDKTTKSPLRCLLEQELAKIPDAFEQRAVVEDVLAYLNRFPDQE